MSNRIARSSRVLIIAVALVASIPAHGAAAEHEGVRKAVEGFYTALNDMFAGNLDRMDAVWSHADDVTYMGPGGDYRVGWQQVRSSWVAQAAMKLGGEVKPDEIRIVAGLELAVVHNLERGANVGAQGETERVRIRATSVFRKEQGSWKMIGHHTDPLPFIEETKGATESK